MRLSLSGSELAASCLVVLEAVVDYDRLFFHRLFLHNVTTRHSLGLVTLVLALCTCRATCRDGLPLPLVVGTLEALPSSRMNCVPEHVLA